MLTIGMFPHRICYDRQVLLLSILGRNWNKYEMIHGISIETRMLVEWKLKASIFGTENGILVESMQLLCLANSLPFAIQFFLDLFSI